MLIFKLNREVVEKFPALRQPITAHLVQTLPEIKSGKVYRGVLWIIGEYSEELPDIMSAFGEIRKVIGEVPILASEQRLLDEAGNEDEDDGKDKEKAEGGGGGKPRVLADGTYATETAFTSASNARLEAVKAAAKPPLRSELSYIHVYGGQLTKRVFLALILGGDFYTSSVLASALTKLVMRFSKGSSDKTKVNSLRAEVIISRLSIVIC